MRIQREAIPLLKDSPNSRGGLTVIEVLVILAIIALLILLLLPATQMPHDALRRPQCRNNFKQIGLALHNYHDVYGSFPPAYTVDASGRRLHSWRTLILPFVDQAPLYMKIDLSKPWDDPVHAEIARTAVSTFACPEFQSERHLTLYHAVVANDSILKPGASAKSPRSPTARRTRSWSSRQTPPVRSPGCRPPTTGPNRCSD
jgi:hypothetical protein